MRVLDLTEETEFRIPADGIEQTSASFLHSQYRNKVATEPPSFLNDRHYVLRPRGWVGILPVDDNLTVRINAKVPVANIFRMWEYAYKLREPEIFETVHNFETLQEVFDSLALVLARKVMRRIRQGLYRDYVNYCEALTVVRGRVQMITSLNNIYRGSLTLDCEYQENTTDLEDNRILAWTMYLLPKLPIQDERIRREITKTYRALANSVSINPVYADDCIKRSYHKMNEDYRPMHGLCRFFLESSGPSLYMGANEMYSFSIYMPDIFEKFIANWLGDHANGHFKVIQQYAALIQGGENLKFVIDVVLKEPTRENIYAVLDTKYKRAANPAENDIQQVVAYAVRMGTNKAILVYPSAVTKPQILRVGDVDVHILFFDIGHVNIEEQGQIFLDQLLLC